MFIFLLTFTCIVLKNNEVIHITVPSYESLSCERIIEEFGNSPQVLPYLCDERDLPKLPRAYLCTLINSITGDRFRQWVQQRIDDRNELLEEDPGNCIELDPDLADAFTRSTSISSKSPHFIIIDVDVNGRGLFICIASKGSGAMLLKVGSKRRRTKNEILGEQVAE